MKAVQEECVNSVAQIKTITENYKDDHQFLNKFKQRLLSDIDQDFGKIVTIAENAYDFGQKAYKSQEMSNKVLSEIMEVLMIESLLQGQEIEDRKKLTLIGHKNAMK